MMLCKREFPLVSIPHSSASRGSFGMTICLFSCGESGGDLLKANRRRFPIIHQTTMSFRAE